MLATECGYVRTIAGGPWCQWEEVRWLRDHFFASKPNAARVWIEHVHKGRTIARKGYVAERPFLKMS